MTRRDPCTRCGQTELNQFWTAWDKECSACQDMAHDEDAEKRLVEDF